MQDPEYWIGFSEFIWEHWETDPNFQIVNMTIFSTFSAFFEISEILWKESKADIKFI